MTKRTLFLVAMTTLALSGCASINKAADTLGVNFWDKGPMKAPCKANASLDTVVVACEGIKLEHPQDADMMKLRGRYGTGEVFILTP